MKLYKHIFTLVLGFLFINFLTGQCYPDRHNTTWYDGWISCESSMNPNQDRGESHWIMYQLGYTYHLGQMHVWNVNAPDYLPDGIRTAAIDLSIDGINWTEVGVFDFEQGTGKSIYEGFEGPDLTAYEAKYLLITALDNFGGSCFGLSEIRVDVQGVTNTEHVNLQDECISINAFPNPASDFSEISLVLTCSTDDIYYSLMDLTGRKVQSGILENISQNEQIRLDLGAIQPGTYLFHLEQNGLLARERIVKIR